MDAPTLRGGTGRPDLRPALVDGRLTLVPAMRPARAEWRPPAPRPVPAGDPVEVVLAKACMDDREDEMPALVLADRLDERGDAAAQLFRLALGWRIEGEPCDLVGGDPEL